MTDQLGLELAPTHTEEAWFTTGAGDGLIPVPDPHPSPGPLPDDPWGLSRWIARVALRRAWSFFGLRKKQWWLRRPRPGSRGRTPGPGQVVVPPAHRCYHPNHPYAFEEYAKGAHRFLVKREGPWMTVGVLPWDETEDPDRLELRRRGADAAYRWTQEYSDHPIAVALRRKIARWEAEEIIAGNMPTVSAGYGARRSTGRPQLAWNARSIRHRLEVSDYWTDEEYLAAVVQDLQHGYEGFEDRRAALVGETRDGRWVPGLLHYRAPEPRREAVRLWLRAEVGSMASGGLHRLPWGWRDHLDRLRADCYVQYNIERKNAVSKEPAKWGRLVAPKVAYFPGVDSAGKGRDDLPRWTEDHLVDEWAHQVGISLDDQEDLEL